MVLVAIVGLCLSVGSVLVYTFGILAKSLGSAFAANRGSMALAITFLNLVVAFSSPITGRLADRFGPKRVIMVSLVGLAGCLFLLSRATPPVWHLWVLYALAGLAGAGSTPVAYARVVTNWFDRNRSLALDGSRHKAPLATCAGYPLAGNGVLLPKGRIYTISR